MRRACDERVSVRGESWLDMEEGASERTGIFVVRAWQEEDAVTFRARMFWTHDATSGDPNMAAASDVAGVSRALEEWLETFTSD